jgi:hypothetical protein
MSDTKNHPGSFVCACCLGTFPWHDEEAALAQLMAREPGLTPADCVMVCDDCYAKLDE